MSSIALRRAQADIGEHFAHAQASHRCGIDETFDGLFADGGGGASRAEMALCNDGDVCCG